MSQPDQASSWVRRNWVPLLGILLIAIQIAWKAQFLSHLYFRQDDFHDLDLAIESPFSWSYLTFIGSGHLIIGLRLVAWVLVRGFGLYNWLAAATISLAFVAAAGLAALRLLRDLFGDRPAILVPLTVYLMTPLTFPDLGLWSSAMESVPLQLAIFMALSAHLRYVGTSRYRHLAAAGGWLAFGLVFFEKALALPLLLLAITVVLEAGQGPLRKAVVVSLRRQVKAWLVYAVLAGGYIAVLVGALHTSASQPQAPVSASAVFSFASELVRDSLLPGAIGGPWQWYPDTTWSFALAAPPPSLAVLAGFVSLAVIGASIWLRGVAWRAWAILAGWILLVDILPVVVGRLNALPPSVLGLETRYLADAAPLLTVCVGLAFLPLAAGRGPAAKPAQPAQLAAPPSRWLASLAAYRDRSATRQFLRTAAAALTGVFAFGSIWSVQAYENVTTGSVAASYVANARQALELAPRGTPVLDHPMPQGIMLGTFLRYAYTSKVVGDLTLGKASSRLRWIARPDGTIDGLRMFGDDGRLRLAQVNGAGSPSGQACWPERNGQITVAFTRASPGFSGTLRIGYIWWPRAPGIVDVQYGNAQFAVAVRHGLHSAYLPVSGRATGMVVFGLGQAMMCVGDVQAGNLGPSSFGSVIPPLPK